jgi:hypothetical protein
MGGLDMRKAYLKPFVDNVIVRKKDIRISGPTGVLAKAAMTSRTRWEKLLLLFQNGVPAVTSKASSAPASGGDRQNGS